MTIHDPPPLMAERDAFFSTQVFGVEVESGQTGAFGEVVGIFPGKNIFPNHSQSLRSLRSLRVKAYALLRIWKVQC
jgi:hypothetical protein